MPDRCSANDKALSRIGENVTRPPVRSGRGVAAALYLAGKPEIAELNPYISALFLYNVLLESRELGAYVFPMRIVDYSLANDRYVEI